MITIRKAQERGRTALDWLDSWHSFSFGDYHDPKQMGFRTLRVLNDDWVGPGGGFGMHPHRDMEIVTYVLEGSLQHHDSLGNGSLIRPGEVQRMTAGTGIMHSEFNASETAPVHLLQVWLLPNRRGLEPGYEQRPFPLAQPAGGLSLVASPTGRDGSLTIHQDADVHAGRLAAGAVTRHTVSAGRHVWVQVANGSARVNGNALETGDGAALSDEKALELSTASGAEVMLFDLA
jgi:redox-sensitive bicupin YhaK (pirin superfamily)